MRRLIRLLIVAGVAWAIWALLRELLDQSDESSVTEESSPPREASSPRRRNGSSGNGSGGTSKAELYRQAQELEVEGRSKMTKEELAAAVAAARSTPA